MVGELGRNYSLFLVGGGCRGYPFGAKVVGVDIFCRQKAGLVRKLAGEHRNGGKITWRGNGGENPRKGLLQLSPCGAFVAV